MAKRNQQRKGKSRRRVCGFLKRLSCTSPPSIASVPSAVASQASVSHSNSQSLSSAAFSSSTSLGSSPSQLPEIPAGISPPLLSSDPLPSPASPLPLLEVSTLPFSSQQSTKSLTIWEEVFCKVNKETTEWIQKRGLDTLASVEKPEDQIKQLTNLIKEKEKTFEEKDSPKKIKIGKQEIVVRAYIADVVSFLTVAGDVAMNFALPQASAPWAAVNAVLKIPVKQIEQMAALAGIIQLFTRIVRRGQVYEILYENAISIKDGTRSNLRSILVDLYVSAIELLARCDSLIESGVVRQTLNSILRPEQVSDLISDLSRKEQILSYEIQSCEALRNEKATKQLDEKLKTLLARLDVTSSPLTRIDKGVAELLENVNNDKLEALMDFISSEQFGKGHATMKDTRIQGTGDWLIDHESFREWQAIASSSTLLCLEGTIGTGKTYLTSRVIDHIKQTLETSPHDEGFAFFYCNRSGPSMQDPLVVLRSFVRQLSYKANNYSYIQSNVIQKCEKAKQEGRSLSYTDCKELILESMNLYSKTTIILDALDESDISSYNLAEIVIDMLEKARKPVKIFISSRPDREFLKAFEDRSTIMVNSSNQEGDIEKYLVEALYSTKFFGKRRLEIQNMIKETFSTRNGGMFRWVYLQTKSLQKCVSDDAIRTWAKTIPRDLMAAYDRLWEDLANQHNECDMVLAECAIKWVLCAFRPLKSGTLLEAIRFAHEEDCLIQMELQTEQEVLSLCQDLLTIDVEKKVWMLPHASVAEYFESRKSKGMGLGECDAFVSKIQLDFLMTPKLKLLSIPYDNDSWKPGEYDDLDSFKCYVQNNWFKHVQRYDKWLGSLEDKSHEPALTSTLKRFLGSPGESSIYYRSWMHSRSLWSLKPANMAIPTMCQYGFYYTLRDWWEKDKIDQKLALTACKGSPRHTNEWVTYTLELAVEGGCLPMCRYLASAIGVVGLRQGICQLAAARALSNKDILRFLVEEVKVDLNALLVFPSCAWTIVQIAIRDDRTRDTSMLQYLVDQGWVSVNQQGGSELGNALIAAAHFGNLRSVEILLRAGADAKIPAESGFFGSALIAVAASFASYTPSYKTVIVALLDSGADINQVPNVGQYGSALEAFICRIFSSRRPSENLRSLRYIQTLKLLLKSGANPAMTCNNIGEHGSALAAAAFYGMKDIVVMLINATGKAQAIKCLRQSRHPSEVEFKGEESDLEAWRKIVAETATYLFDEVGVDKETLRRIGMQDVKFKHEPHMVYIQGVERSTSNIEIKYNNIRGRGIRGPG